MDNTEKPFTYQANFWKAEYQDQLLRSYQANPLIETLPPIYDRNQVYQLLHYDSGYDEQYRQWPPHLRLHLFLEAAHFFQPLSIHFELEERFSRMIRSGYVGRNPLDRGFWPETERRLRIIGQDPIHNSPSRSQAQGFTVFGISGIGKTRTIRNILSLYPQVIQHSQYRGKRFTWTQLVWLTIECPHDGSIKGLCHDFFQQIDMLLGTNYYENHGLRGRSSVDGMRVAMSRVVSDHSLGVLVIDEIQNLRSVSSEGSEKMLSFLVQLDNTIGVPIVFVGTPKARGVLAGEFRRARRAAGQGDLPWERMQKEVDANREKNSEWRLFLETLWRYQYTRENCDLTDELSQVMYDESQGITNIAVKLYFLAQIRAIVREEENITAEIIQKTARESLKSVQEFIYALRTNNQRLLRKYEDIQPIDLEGAVWKALKEINISSGTTQDPSASRSNPNEAKNTLQDKDIAEVKQGDKATQQAKKGVDKQEGKVTTTMTDGGLLDTPIKGREDSEAGYDALKKGGFIWDVDKILVRHRTDTEDIAI